MRDFRAESEVLRDSLNGLLARLQGESAAPEVRLQPIRGMQRCFGLSDFEVDVILLCLGFELDGRFSELLGDSAPTFGYALDRLSGSHWDAFVPEAPLRRWKLLTLSAGSTLLATQMRLEETVLHALMGVGAIDERLLPHITVLEPTGTSPHEGIVSAWKGRALNVNAYRVEARACADLGALAAAECGLGACLLKPTTLPHDPAALVQLGCLWDRHAALHSCALVIPADQEPSISVLFSEQLSGPRLVASKERLTGQFDAWVAVEESSAETQLDMWRAAAGERAAALNGHLEAVAEQFKLDAQSIDRVFRSASQSDDLAGQLWNAARAEARFGIGELAQCLTSDAPWADLVLPGQQLDVLRDIVAHVKNRQKVYREWGFGTKMARGLGISAVFHGPSGTGKTLAAEVLASELKLDLFRIDLSGVVSKYIGETEKNLRRVFDAAEKCGAVLLFDEADALFGKRSEVKDSHDRYANIEVSYLLQRMEAYQGLAILTTNMRDAFDTAFLRRIRFSVHFPFPVSESRRKIWLRSFPSATPLDGLDYDRLAQLNLAGGNIRNVALGAAFNAADRNEKVGMQHVLTAAKSEYRKLEKPLTEAEMQGWPA